jgi:Protein of unknown function (DUF2924)
MHLKSYQIDGRMLRTGAAKAPRQRQPSNTILTRDLPRVSHCRLALGNSSQVYGRKAGQLLKEMAPRVTVGAAPPFFARNGGGGVTGIYCKLRLPMPGVRSLGLDELRTLWRTTFRSSPLLAFPKDLMARFLCWHVQEQAFGGLDPEIAKHLDGLAQGNKPGADRPRRLKPGTVLLREYQGERHTVTVVPNGYVWRETTTPASSPPANRGSCRPRSSGRQLSSTPSGLFIAIFTQQSSMAVRTASIQSDAAGRKGRSKQ